MWTEMPELAWQRLPQGMMNPLDETPLKRESLHVRIAESLQNMLASRQFKPGDKLPTEHELAAIFQVSRPTLREAMRVLQQRGLVQMSAGRGTFVKNIPTTHVAESIERYVAFSSCSQEDLLIVRRIMEPEIAALAAKNITVNLLDRLRGTLEKMNDPLYCQSPERYAEADLEFHETLAEATGNQLIIPLLNGLQRVMKKWMAYQYLPESAEESCRMHRSIFEAVAARNPVAARKAMAGHFKKVRTNIIRRLCGSVDETLK
jgi:GntR family transcriptional regulator, transcriptional repressor for pyruvate dehydrogenase complex